MREKKAEKNRIRIMVMPEYGKQRLLTYADSFKDLADIFGKMNVSGDNSITPLKVSGDRSVYLSRRKDFESREIMAQHFNEMAQIMTEVAGTTFAYEPLTERKSRQITHALKSEGILVKEIYYIENTSGRLELGASLAAEKGKQRTGEEVAHLLSVLLDKRLKISKDTDYYLDGKYREFHFKEEPRFLVLTGAAKAVKENEMVSGDNFSSFETEEGNYVLLLSDGMGSGEKACADSAGVLDLLERLICSGFSVETAIQMVNTSLSIGGGENNMSTLDMCRLDLYEGSMELTKIGAATTYIKRENMVEQISSRSLPLGVFGKLEPENNYRKLMSGDYIILVSDGILDGLSQGIGEDALPELIGRMNLENPKEIANYILKYVIRVCKGSIRDDMTVLVAGIWENE